MRRATIRGRVRPAPPVQVTSLDTETERYIPGGWLAEVIDADGRVIESSVRVDETSAVATCEYLLRMHGEDDAIVSQEPRCEVTELLVSQCGCRAHRGSPPPAPASTDPFESAAGPSPRSGPGPWVPAQFDGECSGCDGALWVGEDIRADGHGGWEGRCCGER